MGLTQAFFILNQGFKYPTIQVILESGFESGSVDLAYLINKALPSFNYDLIICLDDETPNESSVHFVNSMKGSLTFDCKSITVLVILEIKCFLSGTSLTSSIATFIMLVWSSGRFKSPTKLL